MLAVRVDLTTPALPDEFATLGDEVEGHYCQDQTQSGEDGYTQEAGVLDAKAVGFLVQKLLFYSEAKSVLDKGCVVGRFANQRAKRRTRLEAWRARPCVWSAQLLKLM